METAGTLLVYLAFVAASTYATTLLIRKLSWLAILALTLLPLAFTGPALLTGRVYAPVDLPFRIEPLLSMREDVGLTDDDYSRTRYDLAFRIIPWRKVARYALAQGEWPLWNPFMLCGDVLAAASEPAVYHPVNVASYVLPLGPSLTFAATAALFLAGLGAFCFNRELGCRDPPAVLGAAGWMFCGFLVFWLGWALTLAVASFPWLMLAVRRIARQPGWRSVGLLTAILAVLLLAGHPESTLHCVAVAGLYGICELAVADAKRRRRAFAASLAAGLLALLLCAVYLLPFLEALPQSAKYHDRLSAAGQSQSVPWGIAFGRLRSFTVPFVYGIRWTGERIPDTTLGTSQSAYIGSVLLAPALFGLARGPRRFRWLLLALAIGGALVHVAAPGLIDVLARLPLFSVSLNRRLIFVTGFCLSVLAALGCEAWSRDPRRNLGWLNLGVLLALASLIALWWPGMREAGLSAEFLRTRTAFELVPLIATSALLLTVRSARFCVWGLLLVLIGQRVAQDGQLNPTYPAALLYPPVPELEALKDDEEPSRMVAFGNMFTQNLPTMYELEDARGDSPMLNRRLARTAYLWARRNDVLLQVDDLERSFLSFLNVRYALTSRRRPPPKGWEPVVRTRGYAIVENPQVLPRAFVPQRIRFVRPGPESWKPDPQTDFSRLAWIELRDDEPLPEPAEVRNGSGRVSVERRGLALHLEADMRRHGWVVVSQTAWKGWRVTTAGQELPVRYANHAFLAFHLPRGAHEIDLVYRPRSFILGRAVSLLTAAGLMLFAVGRMMFRSRSLPWMESRVGAKPSTADGWPENE